MIITIIRASSKKTQYRNVPSLVLFSRSQNRRTATETTSAATTLPNVPRKEMCSPAVKARIEEMATRHKQILAELQSSSSDYNPSSANLGKELSSLLTAKSLHAKMHALQQEEESYLELWNDAMENKDPDLEQEVCSELQQIELRRQAIEEQMIEAVLPQDEDDACEAENAIIEIRAGTGGEEACLFAGELFEAYIKTARALQWRAERLVESRSDLEGIREGSLLITGRPSVPLPGTTTDESSSPIMLGPYGVFRFESGVHRVQRVPINSTKLQTSACCVAVLPSLDKNNTEDLLPMSELKIETMRASGAGGQHVNSTDSAVRITHLPTGITASIQDERSQHKNKEKALKLIAARVREIQREEEIRNRGEKRSSLMGGGDRSERIRTFNYPQDRVTDHRCKETVHGIATLLSGTKEGGMVLTLLPFLKRLQRQEKLEQLNEMEMDNPTGAK